MSFNVLRSRLVHWFERSANHRILASLLTVGGLSVVVKVAAMGKELVVAYRLGTGDAVDAFLIAFLLPALVVSVITGSFSAALTPAYIKVRETQGISAAHGLLRSAMAGSLVGVAMVAVALLAATPVLSFLAAGFSPAKLALTRDLFRCLLPVIVLNGLIALWSAALNSEGRFAAAALAPLGVPVLTLVALVAAAPGVAGYALAIGTVLGYAVQCVILAIALTAANLPLRPRWGGWTPELAGVVRQYLPMLAGALLMSGTWVIGQAMAASLPSGSVAALNYGTKIPAVMSELGSMALATAVLPHFSVMVAKREWPEIRHTLLSYARWIGFVMLPLTTALVLFSPTIVRLLFERGAFSAADTQTVAGVQALYLLHLPFFMVSMLFVRLASALERNNILLVGAAISLPLTVGFNAVLMRHFGVAGVALATSLVYVVSFVYLFVSVVRAMRAIEHQAAGGAP